MPQAAARRATSKRADVTALIRMHHRRRGWAWVAVGSLIGLAVYAGLDASVFGNLTGSAETFSLIPLFVLLALMVIGFVVVIVDTVMIRHADAAALVHAKRGVSHHPLYAQGHRYPPRHHGSYVFGVFMLVAMTGFAVSILPAEVNSWAYVTGSERADTFVPVSYSQSCSLTKRGGCHQVTHGYLSQSGASVTWGTTVPLSRPFTVRDPVWAWGSGRNLIGSDTSAILTIIAGLFFDGLAILLGYVLFLIVRHSRSGFR
jgi:hypothetical protein